MPSIVDLAVTENINIWKIKTINDLPSDHLPVEITLKEETPKEMPRRILKDYC